MRHCIFYPLIILSGSCLGDVIDINEPTGTEFTYRLATSGFAISSCSPDNFFLEPAMTLPDGFNFVGSHRLDEHSDGKVTPHIYGGYPEITATGHDSGRRTPWPVNPSNPKRLYLGLHWLCKGPYTPGTYKIEVPSEIKVRRTNTGSNEIPSQTRLQLSLWYLNSYGGKRGLLQEFFYNLVPPPMHSAGQIINESLTVLSAGESKEILRGIGRYSSVDICVSRPEGEWYQLKDRHNRNISNGLCMKAQDTLPVSVFINKYPPIGESRANISFTVKIN
ncbi:hypothetical protein HEP02_022915 [Escherichia coli]|uniref:Uncharacterized protein n=1 Tax=Escherichia albertii TaxID=208962 RepID=A0AAX3MRE5_ESCAL|nr:MULTISPECIES: hypothetical protein [Escherichia]MBB6810191.1 hypothetical protein [Escherichia coli]MBB8200491.1 hypothetical protein [Escherichia coli]MCZ8655195.1 hypothetical protein [Escherichia albertii]WDB31953.1 hypothetical protein PS049_26100 [Escherichia albertii]WDB36810.1 hypothetical protein PS032_25905 [Escherichia albertii]